MMIWVIFAGTLLFMELVYHIGCYGFAAVSPLLPFVWITIVASIETLILKLLKKKQQKIFFWSFLIAEYIVFGLQIEYFTVFKQPLQLRAAFLGAEDALTNYYREIGMAFLKALPQFLFFQLPQYMY